ncbi:MAG TPA: 5-formyltetrahydrofolate cyclo-ligase [Verrucomicrobiae bacterium]|nr:5-formyltetrahydrofolate cyclo-ligase [Verrucomicrobiae bacterium]
MSGEMREEKTALRRRIRDHLQSFSPPERRAASARACARLQQEEVWCQSRCVLLYSPLPDELDIEPLLAEALAKGKALALPRFDETQRAYSACVVADLGRDLRKARFGVLEPDPACPAVPLNRLDFVAVPGVAFTLDGRRLGRGKGFYDRLLASVGGIKCGVAFEQQIVSDLPVEPHDIRLDYILTPTRWCRTD